MASIGLSVLMWRQLALGIIVATALANALPNNMEQRELMAKFQLQSRIINGSAVNWPDGTRYQVSVRLQRNDEPFGAGHICGGALIAPDVVLTAAHCLWNTPRNRFRPAKEILVVMGNLQRNQLDNNTLFRNILSYAVAENFEVTSFAHDLAVLLLEQEIPDDFERAVPIALNVNQSSVAAEMCRVTGWGVNEKGAASMQLLQLELPLVNRTICSENYGELLSSDLFCAGYLDGKRDACSGDSGGPLVCDGQLYGIVSFGIGCALSGYPGVYVNVTTYAEWIPVSIAALRQMVENGEHNFSNEQNIDDEDDFGDIHGNGMSQMPAFGWLHLFALLWALF